MTSLDSRQKDKPYSKLAMDGESEEDESHDLIKSNGTHRGVGRNVNRSWDSSQRSCTPTVCATVFAVALLFLGVGYMLGIVVPLSPGANLLPFHSSTNTSLQRQSRSWRTTFTDYGSESCIRLLDVDGDGMDDAIIGLALDRDITTMLTEADMQKYCEDEGMQIPCAGSVVALRGYDGKLLWQATLYAEIFEINCNHIDVNQDGTKDCIVSGRMGTINAIDPKTGEILWTGDPEVINRKWNIYSYAELADFDYDGVNDLVISHGGDPEFPADVHSRRSGWLLALSGATGKALGIPLPMLEERETYCAPTTHTRKDGSLYILYGTGGETVGGRFMAISVPDFYRHIFKKPRDSPVPNVKGNYNQWGFKAPTDKGEITIFLAEEKGVMVPPIMVDMNHDGVKDILMHSFDGHIVLFDGETLEIIWRIKLDGRESYSTPAPGYFNDDGVLDFMIHWCWGAWPYYNSTDTIILDGRDGTILWNMTTGKYDVTSDLIARTNSKNRDVFLFRVHGRLGRDPMERGAIHGATGIQRIITRREVADRLYELHEREDMKLQDMTFDSFLPNKAPTMEDYVECESDQTVYNAELFALDRTTMTHPIKLWERGAYKYRYKLTASDRERARKVSAKYGNVSPEENEVPWSRGKKDVKDDIPLCIMVQPDERSTGALGDVDGDGKLDLLINLVFVGVMRDEHAHFVKMKFDTDIYKITLEDYMQQQMRVPANITVHERMKVLANESPISSLRFLPKAKQNWGAYMGTTGDSVYGDD